MMQHVGPNYVCRSLICSSLTQLCFKIKITVSNYLEDDHDIGIKNRFMEAEECGLFQSFMQIFVVINAKYTATRQKFE